MVPFELLLRAAIGAGVSVPLQNDAADDGPAVRGEPLPVESAYVFKALDYQGLHAAQQRQDGRFGSLPFRFRQARYSRQTDVSNGTANPGLQKQQP